MNNNTINEEWISVSELAENLGVTNQTIYNRVKAHLYEAKKFKRGKMVGWLVRKPKDLPLECTF